MASKFHDIGLRRLMESVIKSGNYVDFGVGSTDPSVVSDANYQSHTIGTDTGQLNLTYNSRLSVSGSVVYTNTNTVYYFDRVAGEGAATSHAGNDNLKWVLIRNSASTLFKIALATPLDVAGPAGSTPGNQVKLSKYIVQNNTMYRGVYIKLSSAVQS